MTNMNTGMEKLTLEQELAALKAEKAQLQAENEALKASRAKGLSFKVGRRGGVAVYGLGRFPITLYKSQWDAFLSDDNITALKAFISAHASELAVLPNRAVIQDATQGQVKAS